MIVASGLEQATVLIGGLAGLVGTQYGHVALVKIGLLLLLLCLAAGRFFRRWIGGISGDCLGAVNQLAELLCYLLIAKSALLETGARHLHL